MEMQTTVLVSCSTLHEIWLKPQFAPGAILRDRGELLENGVEVEALWEIVIWFRSFFPF